MTSSCDPSSLPIDGVLAELKDALHNHAAVILRAEPGAGKTTRVPLALLDEPWLSGRSILMLEPRRLAASNAARYMARSLDEAVGDTVGYTIRYQRKTSDKTRIEVVTEGILTRRLQADPELRGVGLVIFDEFHERNLQSDLALALCREVQSGLRDDLRLLIMSATLDVQALVELLDHAPLIDCPGRQHPIKHHYLEEASRDRVTDQVSRAVGRAVRGQEGDLLVFLPGVGEIRRLEAELSGWARSQGILLAPLYGQLDFAAQERAIVPSIQRKLVLATNIAETSLTIEGVRVVIDCGLERRPRFDPSAGMTRLETVRISRSSARQRSGRAGRLGPGVCYRLWTRGEEGSLLEQTPPEIRQADLSPLLLELTAWGVRDVDQLTWLDSPSASALDAARGLLTALGAIDDQGRLTVIGRKMCSFGCHPRLSRLLVAALAQGVPELGCDLVALLDEPLRARDTVAGGGSQGCDLSEQLESLQRGQGGRRSPNLSKAIGYWRRQTGSNDSPCLVDPHLVAELLAVAYPDRIARRRQTEGQDYLLANGQGVRLHQHSLARGSEWLVAVEIYGGSGGGEISLASSLAPSSVQKLAGESHWLREIVWDDSAARIVGLEVRRLGALVVQQRPLKPTPEENTGAMLALIRKKGLGLLGWNPAALRFRARVELVRRACGDEDWPQLDELWLRENLEVWLAPFLGSVTSLQQLQQVKLQPALETLLNYRQRQQLQILAPDRVRVPSGREVQIDYQPGKDPVLAVKLQELFGLQQTPRIVADRVPLVVQLLSPAGRPLQVTSDLKSFWEDVYPEVRKEMRGRYPKHPWPDDPWNAVPTRSVKRKTR